MIVKLYPENPSERVVAHIAEVLRSDGVVVCPTDGVYAFVCSLHSVKAYQRLKALREKDNDWLSIMCADLSHISDYARVDTPQFKILKRNLPGPFTFILKASSKVPDKALARRKTVGIRMPGNSIPLAIIRQLGSPVITASVKGGDEYEEYTTDPELINERWGERVDMVIDGGYGGLTPTTMVDLCDDEPQVLRQGGGELLL